MPTFALIGYPLSHSFSRTYFTAKFAKLGISENHRYLNFELKNINDFEKKLEEYSDLVGCNVTIPYKQTVIPLLDDLDPVAQRIGAVNTISVKNGSTKGFNTDFIGFRDDLLEVTQQRDYSGERALILGTGGASLAVEEALVQLGIAVQYVSRKPGANQITYDDLDREVIDTHHLIVNTTPLGMYPNNDTAPDLPYDLLTPDHFCYDLVYNPAETTFMRKARGAGAGAANGLGMLHKQAEAAWHIWTGR
jgi:shikimate dehydrogenase